MIHQVISLNYRFQILDMEFQKIYKKIYLDYIALMILEIIIDMV